MLETVKEEVLEKVRKRFENDRFATDNGAVIEAVGEGYARCVMSLDEHHYNAVGSVMGGAIFTLALLSLQGLLLKLVLGYTTLLPIGSPNEHSINLRKML